MYVLKKTTINQGERKTKKILSCAHCISDDPSSRAVIKIKLFMVEAQDSPPRPS